MNAVIASMFSSLLMVVVSVSGSETLHSITWWMMGSLQTTDAQVLTVCAACTLGTLLLFLRMARELDALALGDELAYHLGIRTRTATLLLLATATLATAAAVALAGLIGFVGLIIPHALRRLVGCGHQRLIPLCALYGGLFMIICDTLARICLSPLELPVGVITALCGGPFFLFVLNRRGREFTV